MYQLFVNRKDKKISSGSLITNKDRDLFPGTSV
jgi:hypothetical protein